MGGEDGVVDVHADKRYAGPLAGDGVQGVQRGGAIGAPGRPEVCGSSATNALAYCIVFGWVAVCCLIGYDETGRQMSGDMGVRVDGGRFWLVWSFRNESEMHL